MPENSENAVVQTEQHIDAAVQDVTHAVATAPTDATHDVLASVRDVLQGVQAELKRANDLAEKAVTPAVQAEQSIQPDVDVEVPKPPERKVRRNGRKVVRRG